MSGGMMGLGGEMGMDPAQLLAKLNIEVGKLNAEFKNLYIPIGHMLKAVGTMSAMSQGLSGSMGMAGGGGHSPFSSGGGLGGGLGVDWVADPPPGWRP